MPCPRSRRVLAAALLCLSALAPSCSEPPPRATPRAPVLVIGLDGLEWSVLRPLLAAGRLPNLQSLMERGSFGWLGTFIPTHSPVVWTTIGTGKTMKQHEILGFADNQGRVYTSTQRNGKALWNIADDYGLTSNVFGWWITWPVEPIRGVMVSATSASSMIDKVWKPALMPGMGDQVHPPALTERVMAVAERVGAKDAVMDVAREKVFGDLSAFTLREPETTQVNQSLWSIQSDATYFALAADLLPDHPADLTLFYLGLTDVVGHRFWRPYEPDGFSWSGADPALDAALAAVIPNTYVWADEMIGELLALAGEGANVFVISDHGMHAVSQDKPMAQSGNHQDGAPGVLIAAGPDIRRQGDYQRFVDTGALASVAQVIDVAPTVLGLLGIPAGRDMHGQLRKPLLTDEAGAAVATLERIDSHDVGFRAPSLTEMPDENQDDYIRRLSELGYVMGASSLSDSAPVNPETFVPDTSATAAGVPDNAGG